MATNTYKHTYDLYKLQFKLKERNSLTTKLNKLNKY